MKRPLVGPLYSHELSALDVPRPMYPLNNQRRALGCGDDQGERAGGDSIRSESDRSRLGPLGTEQRDIGGGIPPHELRIKHGAVRQLDFDFIFLG